MILLDTDHLTVLKYTKSERHERLLARLLAAAPEVIGTTIVNVEEQMRGWLSAVAKERTLPRQITAYRELSDLFDFFAKLNVISLNPDAVDLFDGFRKSGVRIGSMDLKMALSPSRIMHFFSLQFGETSRKCRGSDSRIGLNSKQVERTLGFDAAVVDDLFFEGGHGRSPFGWASHHFTSPGSSILISTFR